MRALRFAVCLLAAAFGPVLAGTAAAPAADPLAGAPPELRQAYDAAFQAMLADPADLDRTFEFAKVATRIGDYEGAVAALERMLMAQPNLPRVQLELAALYYRLGSFEMARGYLDAASENPDMPAQVRERADELRERIERELSAHRFGGSLYAGLRYDSNANSLPDDNINIPLSATAEDDVAAFGTLSLNHTFDPRRADGLVLESAGMLFANRHAEQDQVDLTVAEIKSGPRIRLNRRDTESATLRPYGIFTWVHLGDATHYHAPGAGLEISSFTGGPTSVAALAEARHRSFNDTASTPNKSDEDGWELTATLRGSHRITQQTGLSASVQYTRIDAERAWRARDQVGLSAGVAHSYTGLNGTPWNTSLTAGIATSDYDGPELGLINVTRSDTDYRLTLVQTMPVSPSLAAIATVGYFKREANIAVNAFDNVFATLGFSWRFQ